MWRPTPPSIASTTCKTVVLMVHSRPSAQLVRRDGSALPTHPAGNHPNFGASTVSSDSRPGVRLKRSRAAVDTAV